MKTTPAQQKRSEQLEQVWPIATVLIALAVFLIFSNDYDWDHFYAATEVDLRSWLADHRAPVWSYQLCAGVTRLSDPQAFGVSPWFLPVLLLGTVLGLKALLLISAALGWWFLKESAAIVWRATTSEPLTQADLSLMRFFAMAVVLSNYFLWHFHHGHITFALFFSVLGFLYFSLKACFETFTWRDSLAVFVLSFSYLSAGFYHSAIFFALPIAVSLLPLLFHCLRSGILKDRFGNLAFLLVPIVLGGFASFYKTLAVIRYQADFPRTVLGGETESFFTPNSIVFQFIPTFDYHFVGLNFKPRPWGIWEYSSFNWLAWITLIAFVALAARRLRLLKQANADTAPSEQQSAEARESHAISIWLFSLLLVALSYSLSANNPLSLHHWVNHALHGSVRVIGRFQILWVILAFFTTIRVFAKHSFLRTYLPLPMRIAIAGAMIANLLTFSTLSLTTFHHLMNLSNAVPDHMNQVYVVPLRNMHNSFMFDAIVNGGIVPNCYNPISRRMALMGEFSGRPEFMGSKYLGAPQLLPLVRLPAPEPSELSRCAANSYVTQNDLVIDSSCASKTCFNLNGMNVHQQLPDRIAFDPKLKLWCVK